MKPTDTMPMLLRDALEPLGLGSVDAWWMKLSSEEHTDILELWTSCQTRHFGPGTPVEQPMTARVEGRLSWEDNELPEFWHADFYEYLVNHEEYYYEAKTFHVCHRQAAALAVVKAGFVPGDFQCPVDAEDCPLATSPAVRYKRAMRFSIIFVPAQD